MTGHAIGVMLQVFVPKQRLACRLGRASPGSVTLATVFGAVSSSCAFAALAASAVRVSRPPRRP